MPSFNVTPKAYSLRGTLLQPPTTCNSIDSKLPLVAPPLALRGSTLLGIVSRILIANHQRIATLNMHQWTPRWETTTSRFGNHLLQPYCNRKSGTFESNSFIRATRHTYQIIDHRSMACVCPPVGSSVYQNNSSCTTLTNKNTSGQRPQIARC